MLQQPVPMKHQMSRSRIFNRDRLVTSRKSRVQIVVTHARMATILMASIPYPFSVRTKIPILPQRIPASKIKKGADFFIGAFSFFF